MAILCNPSSSSVLLAMSCPSSGRMAGGGWLPIDPNEDIMKERKKKLTRRANSSRKYKMNS